MRLLFIAMFCLLSQVSTAECRYVWIDHDFNSNTPLIQRQICDSPIDLPGLPSITTPPIQLPNLRPIGIDPIPNLGFSECSYQNVYENGQWVSKKVCS